MVSSFGNACGLCILLHVILPAAAHLGERGTTVSILQERTEMRYWCPVDAAFVCPFFLMRSHCTASRQRDARCNDAYEFREALNFYEVAYYELTYLSPTLHTHAYTYVIIASYNTLMWNRSVLIRSFVISFIGNR